ncbi:hypothetical protein HK096_000755, partial [Nowakowskiella sp. JEL0078]
KELEQQFEQLLNSYSDRLQQKETKANEDILLSLVENRVESLKQREVVLQQRIIEFEILVNEQNSWIAALKKEKIVIENELRVKAQEKDKIIEIYEKKIFDLRKQYHDNIFSVQEQKYLTEIRQLRVEVEALRRENANIKNNEETRKGVHETTITILRQAQEDAAKIALQHHERALSVLRNETNSKSGQMFESEVRSLKRRLKAAELDAVESEKKSSKLELLLKDLENSSRKPTVDNGSELIIRRLQNENKRFVRELEKAKLRWPLERQTFDELQRKVIMLEEQRRKHESEMELILSRKDVFIQNQIEALKKKFVKKLQKKDEEILKFKERLEDLTRDLFEIEQSM